MLYSPSITRPCARYYWKKQHCYCRLWPPDKGLLDSQGSWYDIHSPLVLSHSNPNSDSRLVLLLTSLSSSFCRMKQLRAFLLALYQWTLDSSGVYLSRHSGLRIPLCFERYTPNTGRRWEMYHWEWGSFPLILIHSKYSAEWSAKLCTLIHSMITAEAPWVRRLLWVSTTFERWCLVLAIYLLDYGRPYQYRLAQQMRVYRSHYHLCVGYHFCHRAVSESVYDSEEGCFGWLGYDNILGKCRLYFLGHSSTDLVFGADIWCEQCIIAFGLFVYNRLCYRQGTTQARW